MTARYSNAGASLTFAALFISQTQGLHQVAKEKDQQIADLTARVAALETLVRSLAVR